jgi:CBS domain-containing protein
VTDEKGHLKGMLSYAEYMKVLRNIYNTPFERSDDRRYLDTVLVQDVMANQYQIICVDAGASIEEAMRIFRANRFHALPVVGRNGLLHGILTTHDLLNVFGDHFLKIS